MPQRPTGYTLLRRSSFDDEQIATMSLDEHDKKDAIIDDHPTTESIDELDHRELATEQRPPIEWTSIGAFTSSVGRRIKSIWTKRFVLSLLAGQVVSLCITCTNVTTTELVMRNWALPTTQTFFLYTTLFLVYTPYTMYQYGLRGWGKMVLRDGWKYFILAACDVEGNFLVVKAYEYTDLLSCMLLDAWAIPVCLFFSWIYMKPKYHWTQILGVVICIAGLGMLVASDQITQKDWTAVSRGKGDAFMIAGATLYGFSMFFVTVKIPSRQTWVLMCTLFKLMRRKNSSFDSPPCLRSSVNLACGAS
ncbi:hypothetical protein HGRIS_004790 [Hohenbuehelia grisea]|uniref:Solute carrier family 35 member F1 n=1 Tax=Hohenbuehelia grisea TaxID=104357 RepID=A0ABR3JD72_9AGAR